MEQFKVFRAIGLSFKAWFANFIPITLLAAVLYAPVILLSLRMPKIDSVSDLEHWASSFQHVMWAIVGASSLLSPLLIYRVIQYLNGQPSSMVDSIRFGMRGIVPAVLFAAVVSIVGLVPFGGIISAILSCMWFVTAPAAVVERLNPINAFARSNALTQGRRWGIFGMSIVLNLGIIVIMVAYLGPVLTGSVGSIDQARTTFEHFFVVFLPVVLVYQLFIGIAQAVSYSLLRADKDGVSNDELAKVFE